MRLFQSFILASLSLNTAVLCFVPESSRLHSRPRVYSKNRSVGGRGQSLQLAPLLLSDEAVEVTSYMLSNAASVSPEPIHTAFSLATFLPQPFWLLMILAPNARFTKQVMGGFEIPLLVSLIHFFIVAASIATQGSEVTAPLSEFSNVFDPSGDPQRAFMGMVSNYPNFVAEEWSHVLVWDLFVGRYIWLDGIQRNIFTSHSVLLCNLIGPPGLLLHWLTCQLIYRRPVYEPDHEK